MLLICYNMLAFICKSKYTSLYLDHVCVLLLKKKSGRLGGWNKHEWTTQLSTPVKLMCSYGNDEIFQHWKTHGLVDCPWSLKLFCTKLWRDAIGYDMKRCPMQLIFTCMQSGVSKMFDLHLVRGQCTKESEWGTSSCNYGIYPSCK